MTEAALSRKMAYSQKPISDNPHSRSTPKCPLWVPKDIERLQRSAFRSGTLDRIKKRSAAGEEAADTKRAQMSVYLEAVHITLPRMPLDELIRQACNYYNDRQIERFFNRGDGDGLRASPQDDLEFLARNYCKSPPSRTEQLRGGAWPHLW